MKKIILFTVVLISFLSCDPAASITIENDTEQIYIFDLNDPDLRFPYDDPHLIAPGVISIEANDRCSFSIMGVFHGISIQDMKEVISRLTVFKITEDRTVVIAEGVHAQNLLSESIRKVDDSWIIYCSDLK